MVRTEELEYSLCKKRKRTRWSNAVVCTRLSNSAFVRVLISTHCWLVSWSIFMLDLISLLQPKAARDAINTLVCHRAIFPFCQKKRNCSGAWTLRNCLAAYKKTSRGIAGGLLSDLTKRSLLAVIGVSSLRHCLQSLHPLRTNRRSLPSRWYRSETVIQQPTSGLRQSMHTLLRDLITAYHVLKLKKISTQYKKIIKKSVYKKGSTADEQKITKKASVCAQGKNRSASRVTPAIRSCIDKEKGQEHDILLKESRQAGKIDHEKQANEQWN